MRILVITFALALFGCIDGPPETPEGVDDVEEEYFGPDGYKSDVDPAEPGEPTTNLPKAVQTNFVPTNGLFQPADERQPTRKNLVKSNELETPLNQPPKR